MFGPDWSTSPREYEVTVERDVTVPGIDGVELVGDLFRPATDRPVPVIAGFHPYNNEFQTAPITPEGFSLQRGWMESGDPYFFARRGYAHLVANVRGTGKSGGTYQAMGPKESLDVAAAVQWLADQRFSSGAVGLFGISYFSWLHLQTAMHEPPALKAVFAPFGATDFYRDFLYHGGILSYRFLLGWKDKLDGVRYDSWHREHLGPDGFERAISQALADEEIAAVPELVSCLRSPTGADALVADVVLASLDGEFWQERRVDYSRTSVPAYLGACWGLDGLHLPAAFRSYLAWKGPARLMVGPDVYLDRPLYQLQHEAVRFFDQFLKGNDTGRSKDPPIELFVSRTGRWKRATAWPLPETRFTPFHLHPSGLLSEREPAPALSRSAYEDSPFLHGELRFSTPPLVEETELVGPAVLNLYCSSSDDDALVFASLHVVGGDGTTRELARSWLRASQAEKDPASPPYAPRQLHARRQPLVPDQVVLLEVGFSGMAVRLLPGERLVLRITSSDDEPPPDPLRATGCGHVSRQRASVVTVHHDSGRPSFLVLPVTDGNLLGTFLSGGALPGRTGPIPTAKIKRLKAPPGPGGDSAG